MRHPWWIWILASLPVPPAVGQDTPSGFTDDQVSAYRVTVRNACRNGERKKGGPEDAVDAYCVCMMHVLDRNMTYHEWRQALLHSSKQQHAEELLVLARHMPKTQVCRSGS